MPIRPSSRVLPLIALLLVPTSAAALPCAGSRVFEVDSVPADSGVTQVFAALLDADGAADLILVRGGLGSFEVRLHAASEGYTSGTFYAWGTSIQRALVADLNADGRPDLAFTDAASRVVIFRGVADGSLAHAQSITLGYPGFDVVAANLNAAGGLELVVSHPTAGRLTSLMWTSGPFNYSQVVTSTSTYAPDPNYLALARLTPDALVDVVVTRRGNARLWLYRGTGTGAVGDGRFSASTSLTLSSPPTAIDLQDLDLDGHLDLLCGTAGAVHWEFGSGSGSFADGANISLPNSPVVDIVVADLGRDGAPDILCARTSAHVVTHIAGKGARRFVRADDYLAGSSPVSLVELEWEGTGAHDFAVGQRGSEFLGKLVSYCDYQVDPPPGSEPLDPGDPMLPAPEPPPDPIVAPPPPPPAPPDPGPAPAVAPWPAEGIVVCDAPGDQSGLRAQDDFRHGAYFGWVDARSGSNDIYVTRIGPDGQPVEGWLPNGTPVCAAPGPQHSLSLLSDGPWGVWALWLDGRDGPLALYVQKLTPDGLPAPGWPANGRRVCDARFQAAYHAAPDLRGGLQLAWRSDEHDSSWVYVHHLDSEGAAFGSWPECGVRGLEIFDRSTTCTRRTLGWRGAVPQWPDGMLLTYTSGTQCIGSFENCHGCIPGNWLGTRLVLPGSAENTLITETVADSEAPSPATAIGCEPYYYFWEGNGSTFALDAYDCFRLFRFGGFGIPGWTAVLPTYFWAQPDGLNGFDLVINQSATIHWSKLGNDGSWSAAPGTLGTPACEAPCVPETEAIVADGAGGVLAVWRDRRGLGSQTGPTELYATWLRGDGSRGDGWNADGNRIVTGPLTEDVEAYAGSRRGAAILGWRDARSGHWDVYAQRITTEVPAHLLSSRAPRPAAATAGAAVATLAISGLRPNPAVRELEVDFTLPRRGDAFVRLVDVAGRIVLTRRFPQLAPGPHSVTLRIPSALQPGIYVVDLAAAAERRSRKITIHR